MRHQSTSEASLPGRRRESGEAARGGARDPASRGGAPTSFARRGGGAAPVRQEAVMEVRAQSASVFHLDKCIGCHTCSVVCKNLWTDRRGSEHMWWNNVETRPGTGYPPLWEDQER